MNSLCDEFNPKLAQKMTFTLSIVLNDGKSKAYPEYV